MIVNFKISCREGIQTYSTANDPSTQEIMLKGAN